MIKCGCNPTDPCDACIEASFDPMITATQHLEASPKPSYGPHKASERYLDAEDEGALNECLESFGVAYVGFNGDPKIESVLQALETLRTHLRKKYYAG